MVDLKSKRCVYHGSCEQLDRWCVDTPNSTDLLGGTNFNSSNVPSYGVHGSNKRVFCSEHKWDGMVSMKSKRCSHHGVCTKQPSCGVDGSNKREFALGTRGTG